MKMRISLSSSSKYGDCAICLSAMNDSENIVLTRCHHNFHERCLIQAKERKSNCPLCRFALTPLASTLTPVIYFEMEILPANTPVPRLASTRFFSLEESNAPPNPYREEIIRTSRRVRWSYYSRRLLKVLGKMLFLSFFREAMSRAAADDGA